jgi:myosin heavy subunit
LIFTNIGTTLIAVNPYKQIPNLFNETLLSEFAENILKGKPLGIPHIYLIAGKAFYDMRN